MTTEQKIEKILKERNIFRTSQSFNWEDHSWLVAKFCPKYIDKNKFNWKIDSWTIPRFCPKYLNADKFNWNEESWAVIMFCPQYLDVTKTNLKNITNCFPQYKNMSPKKIKEHAILNKI